MAQTTARNPVNAVQKAIVTTLRADGALSGMLPGGVHDEPPERITGDYLRLGDHLSTPDNTMTTFGRQITTTLHVWTKSEGNKRGQDIANRVIELLDHKPAALDVDGHKIVIIRCEFDQALRDPNPLWRHHVIRFRINTEQED
ncbi:DUF3168 domain-containing protein [Mangrovihabitans endophyticus]|uniref:DUF3168 domain-containing protein n=1 Tax=Mangrovihabitans endophyticus TaxID=1751298 RepID=A0A8J3BZK5_9ACTN|nr:DUF3168 domain-containing protein [Mangrovihabitans endophyticus]GGK89166.1 hypothetical protein GCM10012284_23980 [Mangrovihabitans endophyticus]